MSDGMARTEGTEKHCYEAVVAEVMNGFVVKVGCKTFVGKAKDLPMLLEYYQQKKVPTKLKKVVGAGAFRDDVVREAEDCKGGCEEYGPGVPSFLREKDGTNILRVTNGWVVLKGGQAYIATTKDEMVKLID